MSHISYQRSKWESAQRATRNDFGGQLPEGPITAPLGLGLKPRLQRRTAGKRYPQVHVTTNIPDVRDMLMQLGLYETSATLVIPYVNFLPRTSDAAAQGIMVIVGALQRRLHGLGFPLRTDGYMGTRTTAALEVVSGPNWRDKTWLQLMGDVLAAKGPHRVAIPKQPPLYRRLAPAFPGMSPVGDFTDLFTDPLKLVVAAGVIYWLVKR